MSSKSFIVNDLKTRLDKALVSAYPEISRSKIQKDIETGSVMVNGEKVLISKFVVRQGDKIQYHQSAVKEEVAGRNVVLKTLYNNHGLLIIDKPAGLAVHYGWR